ncbi:ABC transporter substrate-binding protein [Solibacillus merdavium]|uniref:ABC transporter substrate-binding protein n=1 Tax=Solibacillus merdavium TaxID=2762218 RepID=A0ABR8XPZ4_9BACL|nr:ABC transporter substrate-binding protein [Solibacillus merdavium]MBD8034023.1 ABC transporter substrate-binding protein [Solibacillus merdavium]
MNSFWSWFGIIFAILFVIGFIMSYWMYIVGAIALFFGVKRLIAYTKEKQHQKVLIAESKRIEENQSTIEYKMDRLLTLTNNTDPNGYKRQQYKNKQQLDLRDYWYKYLDLRAKLILNNTSTYREEEVLHIMCDELLNRMDNLEIEVTDAVKKEFIEENLTPLLRDVVEIMEGISPIKTININAYQLLKATSQ